MVRLLSAERKLQTWLQGRGFTVRFAHKCADEVDFDRRLVSINASSSASSRVSALLHECGHVLIWRSRCENHARRVCGRSLEERLLEKGRGRKRTSARRLAVLQEEVEAWDRGWALRGRLRVRANQKSYERIRSSCLTSYVKWAALSKA